MSRAHLIRRLGWYYPTELFNTVAASGVILYVLFTTRWTDTLFLIYGLVIVTWILYQGQHYWGLKLRRLNNRPVDQPRELALFRAMEHSNLWLIGLMPFVLLVQLVLADWSIGPEHLLPWALLANGFAILEHINYYIRQLTVDNWPDVKYLLRNRRLKPASLRKDLESGRI